MCSLWRSTAATGIKLIFLITLLYNYTPATWEEIKLLQVEVGFICQ